MKFVLAIVLGLLGGAAIVLLLQRRQTEKMRALMDRLQQLQEMETEAPHEPGPWDHRFELQEVSGEHSVSQLTADVLAGRTTHVRLIIEEGATQGLPLADQAIIRIHAHMEDNLAPAELAGELNVSLRSLERGLALALDCTPRELILALKMREARRLLERGELNVTGVAYRLGFSSPSHFSRRFRAFFKVPPSEIARRAA